MIPIIQKYYTNTKDISAKDHQLLNDIFVKHGLEKFLTQYQHDFKDYIQNYLSKVFNEYTNSLSKEDLKKEKTLLEWYDNIKELKRHQERIEEFKKVYDFEED